MPYETGFPYMSQTSSFFEGFLYAPDPLRINTNFFYQLSYVIGEAIGAKGSYAPYQFVYALLWLGRGLLSFLIVRRLVPRSPALAYAVGALVVVHASDRALNWVGQMNQFGMIFWLLLAIYLLLVSFQAESTNRAAIALGTSMLATFMCLWSYESGLFIVVAAPLLLLALLHQRSRRARVTAAIFYLVPLVYVAETIQRYAKVGSQTYQSTVVRSDRQVSHLLSDLLFNAKASLEFWRWSDAYPPVHPITQTLLSVGAALAFVLGGAVLAWRSRRQERLVGVKAALAVLGSGILLLILSFPAYLILTSARQLWRTQFLSGIGAALVFAGLGALVVAAGAATGRRGVVAGIAVALALGAGVAYSGAGAAYRAGGFHYGIWVRHRVAVVEVLRLVPRIEPNSLVVLTNVPKSSDPFGDNMWFDFAMRMAYPNEPVSGVYYYADGQPSPNDPFALEGRLWQPLGIGYPPLVATPHLDHTIIIRYGTSGRGRLLKQLPRFLAGHAATHVYAPVRAIEPGPPSSMAQWRYHP